MKKIPVGATIALAYCFAVSDFFKIFGIMWLPWALMVAGGLALSYTTRTLTLPAPGSPVMMWRILMFLVPFYVVMAVFLFMQVAGVLELALGQKTGSPHYYFSLGKPVWRLVGGFLLLVVLVIACWLVAVIGGIVLTFIANLAAKAVNFPGLTKLVMIPVAMAAFCTYVYAVVRLGLLWMPVIIAEEKISLRRAWMLGHGNFWCMFLILLAIIVPVIAIEFGFIFKFILQGMPFAPPNATPDQLAAAQAAVTAWTTARVAVFTRNWYVFYPLFVAFAALVYGLSCGAQSFAYRALTEADSIPSPL
jgi:hypothetical protein